MLEDLIKPSKDQSFKLELHAQTNAFTPHAAATPEEVLAMAAASGYSAIFLTERGRVWPERQLAALRELSLEVRLYPGIEVPVSDGHHILVLGATDPVYETFTEAGDVLAQAAKDGLLTVLAAPADPALGMPEWLPLVDAIELQTCYQADDAWRTQAESRAQTTGIAPIQAGGVQGLNYMNKFWIEVDAPFDTPQELRNLVVADSFRNAGRDFDMQVPPPFKTPRMVDLTDADSAALPKGQEPSLSAE